MQRTHVPLVTMVLVLAGLACGGTSDDPLELNEAPPPADVVDVEMLVSNISGWVWIEDGPPDGIRSEGEDPAKGVPVNLYLVDEGEEVFQKTTYTMDTGQYEFPDLASARTYLVLFDMPEGYLFTKQDAGDDFVDSDAIQDGIDRGKTGPFTPQGGRDDRWSAGLVFQANTFVWEASDDSAGCEDMNTGTVDCDFALTGFELLYDGSVDGFRFIFDVDSPQSFENLDVCVLFDTVPDAGGLEGEDQGYCVSVFENALYRFDYGPSGAFAGSVDLAPSEGGFVINPESTPPDAGRLEFWIARSVFDIEEGRVRGEIFQPPTVLSGMPWSDDALDKILPTIP